MREPTFARNAGSRMPLFALSGLGRACQLRPYHNVPLAQDEYYKFTYLTDQEPG
jgi:hypothetical protein